MLLFYMEQYLGHIQLKILKMPITSQIKLINNLINDIYTLKQKNPKFDEQLRNIFNRYFCILDKKTIKNFITIIKLLKINPQILKFIELKKMIKGGAGSKRKSENNLNDNKPPKRTTRSTKYKHSNEPNINQIVVYENQNDLPFTDQPRKYQPGELGVIIDDLSISYVNEENIEKANKIKYKIERLIKWNESLKQSEIDIKRLEIDDKVADTNRIIANNSALQYEDAAYDRKLNTISTLISLVASTSITIYLKLSKNILINQIEQYSASILTGVQIVETGVTTSINYIGSALFSMGSTLGLSYFNEYANVIKDTSTVTNVLKNTVFDGVDTVDNIFCVGLILIWILLTCLFMIILGIAVRIPRKGINVWGIKIGGKTRKRKSKLKRKTKKILK